MGLKPVELFIPLGKKPKRCWKKTTTSKSLDISHVRKFYKWIGHQATEAYMFPLHTKWLLQNEEKLLFAYANRKAHARCAVPRSFFATYTEQNTSTTKTRNCNVCD